MNRARGFDLSLHSQGREAASLASTIRLRNRSDRAQTSEGQYPASSPAGPEPRARAPPRAGSPPARPASAPEISKHHGRGEPLQSSPSRNPATAPRGASPSETSPEKSWFLLLHHEFDAAIARLAFVGIVHRRRVGAAVP